MSKEAMKLAKAWFEQNTYGNEAVDVYEALCEALAEQPAQQEPVAYGMWDTMLGKGNRMMMVRLDKGQDGCTVPLYTTPQPPAQPLTDEWVPVTEKLLNEQHPWLYEPMWIAKGCMVVQGYYEWRQGGNPDRFITDGGEEWAFNFDYVMPIVKPTPPTEAAHGITKGGAT